MDGAFGVELGSVAFADGRVQNRARLGGDKRTNVFPCRAINTRKLVPMGLWLYAPCLDKERRVATDDEFARPRENCGCKNYVPYSTEICKKSPYRGCGCNYCIIRDGTTKTRVFEECCADPTSHRASYNFAWRKTKNSHYRRGYGYKYAGVLGYTHSPGEEPYSKRAKPKPIGTYV